LGHVKIFLKSALKVDFSVGTSGTLEQAGTCWNKLEHFFKISILIINNVPDVPSVLSKIRVWQF